MDAEAWDQRYSDSELVWSADAEPVRRRASSPTCRPAARSTSPPARAATRSGWPGAAGRSPPSTSRRSALDKGRQLAGDAAVDVGVRRRDDLAGDGAVRPRGDRLPPAPGRRASRGRAQRVRVAARRAARFLLVAHDSTNLTEGTGGPQDPARADDRRRRARRPRAARTRGAARRARGPRGQAGRRARRRRGPHGLGLPGAGGRAPDVSARTASRRSTPRRCRSAAPAVGRARRRRRPASLAACALRSCLTRLNPSTTTAAIAAGRSGEAVQPALTSSGLGRRRRRAGRARTASRWRACAAVSHGPSLLRPGSGCRRTGRPRGSGSRRG